MTVSKSTGTAIAVAVVVAGCVAGCGGPAKAPPVAGTENYINSQLGKGGNPVTPPPGANSGQSSSPMDAMRGK